MKRTSLKKATCIASTALTATLLLCIAGCSPATNSPNSPNQTSEAHSTCGMHEGVVSGCSDCHDGSNPDQYTYTADMDEKCMSCHGDRDTLVQLTPIDGSGFQFNPHFNHFSDELACASCHTNHEEDGASTLYCTSCHIGMNAPDGWESADQGDLVPKWMDTTEDDSSK